YAGLASMIVIVDGGGAGADHAFVVVRTRRDAARRPASEAVLTEPDRDLVDGDVRATPAGSPGWVPGGVAVGAGGPAARGPTAATVRSGRRARRRSPPARPWPPRAWTAGGGGWSAWTSPPATTPAGSRVPARHRRSTSSPRRTTPRRPGPVRWLG